MLTRQEVERALPANLKGAATQSLTDKINNAVADPDIADQIRNNFIGYTTVLRNGQFKTEDYLNAVMYVSYKLMGYTNQDAFFRTFPQRHANLVSKGATNQEIGAHVASYARGKLVNLILEQSLVPTHVLNFEIYQKAINVQADLMLNANSEKVRSDAANSLLTHLAKPKEVAPAVNVNIADSGMNELKEMLGSLVRKQIDLIEGGAPIRAITDQKLIEGEVIENVPN